MKKIVLLGLLMMTVVSVAHAQVFYLVRHAEKQIDGSKDPKLTESGQTRAENLAFVLSQAGISHVFATDYQRTQSTAQPLAAQLGIPITSYDPSNLVEFAALLKTLTGNALIVGHSNTTPELVHLMSGQVVKPIDENEYDQLYQVTINGAYTGLNQLKLLPAGTTQD